MLPIDPVARGHASSRFVVRNGGPGSWQPSGPQLFWLSDALENQKTIPWSYVGQALGYVIGYLGASLALALLLFEDRELT